MISSTNVEVFNQREYVREKFLGYGGNCTIEIYKNTKNGHRVAVKQTGKNACSLMEIKVLKSLKNCKRIIHYFHHRETYYDVIIYMELADEDLYHYIKEKGPVVNSLQFWKLAFQLSEGVYFLHTSGFIHNDLKPKNILVINGSQLKIADFGSSEEIAKNPTTRLALTIVAPEIMLGQPCDEKVDLWCLGFIFYYIATGYYPFDYKKNIRAIGECIGYSSKYLELVKNHLSLENIDYPLKPALPAMKTCLGRTNSKAINSCLQSDPSLRINAAELLQLLNKFSYKVNV